MKNNRLTDRQRKIILMLAEKNGMATTISDIAKSLDLSSRTVKRDMVPIEAWFDVNDFKLSKKPGVGIFIDENEEMLGLIRDLLEIEKVEKSFQKEERMRFILSRVLSSGQPIKYYVFTNYLGISSKTLTQDLNDAEVWLEKSGVRLMRKQGEGVYISGSEEEIRRAQIDLIYENLDNSQRIEIIRNISEDAKINFIEDNDVLSMIDKTTMEKVNTSLNMTFKRFDLRLSDNSYVGLLVHISLAIERIKSSKQEFETKFTSIESLVSSREYLFAEVVAEELEREFEMSIPKSEVLYIAMHISGANIISEDIKKPHKDTNFNFFEIKGKDKKGLNYGIDFDQEQKYSKLVQRDDEVDIDSVLTVLRLAKNLIRVTQEELGLDFGDNKLERDFKNHLKSAVSRLKMKMKIRNPILDEIKSRYPEIFGILKRVFPILAGKEGIILENESIPDDEIGYLTIHIAAAIERNISLGKVRIITACPTGIGTSRLLSSKLESIFSNIDIIGNISIFDLDEKSLDKKDVDLIISTVKLNDMQGQSKISGTSYICVDAIPTEEDIYKIRNLIRKISRKKLYDTEKVKEYKRVKSPTCEFGSIEDIKRIYLLSQKYFEIQKNIKFFDINFEGISIIDEKTTVNSLKDSNISLLRRVSDEVAKSVEEKEAIFKGLLSRSLINFPYFEDLGLYLFHCKAEVDCSCLSFGRMKNIRSGGYNAIVVMVAPSKNTSDITSLFGRISSHLVESEEFLEDIKYRKDEKIGEAVLEIILKVIHEGYSKD